MTSDPVSTTSRTRRRAAAGAAVLLATLALAACLPTQPATGRGTHVRRVLLLGDSMSFGLFGTTPGIQDRLGLRMMRRHIALTVDGFPAETPIDVYPGHPRWADRMRWWIADQDPDMVIIQSTLFVNPTPERQQEYRAAITELFDIAQSRGAHVYIVSHQLAPNPKDHDEALVAQGIQGDVAASRGISTIPLDWWIARCPSPTLLDGWHLTANGEDCYADGISAAVDQLKRAVG